MFRPNRLHLTALACVALLIAACGQKPGVADQVAGGILPPGATINEQGQVVDAQGNVIGSAGDFGSSGSLGGGSATDGTSSGGVTGGTNSGSSTTGSSTTEPSTTGANQGGATSVGVTGNKITIGSHAPLTGAAPVPSE